MKKLMPIIFILALAACSKNVSTNGGSWVFHNQTYHATQAYYILGGLAAYTGANVPTGSLALWFNSPTDTTWPVKVGNYILTKTYPPAPGYVFLQITDTSIRNSYSISGTTTPIVTVDTLSNGFYVVTIPPVEVINTNDSIQIQVPPFSYIYIGKRSGTDSSLVSGTIIQTK